MEEQQYQHEKPKEHTIRSKNTNNGLAKGLLLGFVFGILAMGALITGAIADRYYNFPLLDRFLPKQIGGVTMTNRQVLNEESIVIDVAERVSPSVVTVSVETPRRRVLEFNPFGGGFSQRYEGGRAQDIGTGFVVSEDGLIVTNKHVVSETGASYKVITKDGKEYNVEKVSRDPSNDLAVIKIDASGLTPIPLGNSENLKVGQFVIAIGTALGEFRHTVTTGVISGLGRGIIAGSAFQGSVEELDDVIQTDAAINPGNSGGPLLNSVGEVIGVNVAVAQGAENVGFAIPVDVVRSALDTFRETGSFASKPFLGVQYQMISRDAAVLNELPQGAYIEDIVDNSPASKAGLRAGDIVTKIDGEDLRDEDGKRLAEVVATKRSGQQVNLEVWRDGETLAIQVSLSEAGE